jgi:F-type H+-transporting ATPase subunit a
VINTIRGYLTPRVLGTLAVIFLILLFGRIMFAVPLPGIQLPAEVIGHIGPLTITNTLLATILTDITVLLLALATTANLKLVPSGLQNLMEMVIEGFYGLAEDLGGARARQFFPWAMTFFLLITISNWWELVPGFDSIGWLETHPGMAHYEVNNFLGVRTIVNSDPFVPEGGHGAEDEHAVGEATDEHAIESEGEPGNEVGAPEGESHAGETEAGEAEGGTAEGNLHEGDMDAGGSLAVGEAGEAEHGTEAQEGETGEVEHGTQAEEGAADHSEQLPINEAGREVAVLVPFFRAAATDLNFTLALALISVFMAQYYGVQALGNNYFKKFWNTEGGALGFIVGIIELISEFSKILSFGFRLFGNIFGGQVLLFVMAFLIPWLLPLPFFLLESFVGMIQGFVFAMLTLVFFSSAVISHDGHDDHGHGHGPDTHGHGATTHDAVPALAAPAPDAAH